MQYVSLIPLVGIPEIDDLSDALLMEYRLRYKMKRRDLFSIAIPLPSKGIRYETLFTQKRIIESENGDSTPCPTLSLHVFPVLPQISSTTRHK